MHSGRRHSVDDWAHDQKQSAVTTVPSLRTPFGSCNSLTELLPDLDEEQAAAESKVKSTRRASEPSCLYMPTQIGQKLRRKLRLQLIYRRRFHAGLASAASSCQASPDPAARAAAKLMMELDNDPLALE